MRIIFDRFSGDSKGYGFIDFDTTESAEKAIGNLQEIVELEGRKLRFELVRPPNEVASRGTANSTSLYIGNLDFECTEQEFMQFLASKLGQGGYKAARIQFDPESGRCRGFAHVDFETSEACESAMNRLKECDLRGRAIRVDFPKRASSPRVDEVNATKTESLFISNLDYDVTTDVLKSMVDDVVGVTPRDIRMLKDKITGNSRGIAFMDFDSVQSAEKALEVLNKTHLAGRAMKCRFAAPR